MVARRRLAVLGAVLACVVASAAADAPPDDPVRGESVLEERSRVRLRTVRLRFEPTRDARPGECRELGLDDLRVRLRGEWLPPDHLVQLERRREPTAHAILIDTSGSMVGKLDHARRAATEYVRRLDPEHDRAFVATFDESVVLAHPLTRDRDALAQAIGAIRMGAMTSLLDGLYFGIGELSTHRERPVVVLLSDGVDSASLEEHRHVRALAEARDDLIVFTVGYQLPPLGAARSGTIATRTFLIRLAETTDGEFFDVPTGGRLDFAFRKIREALESEALLTFLDPAPDAPLGKVRVRLPSENCRLHVYRTSEDAEGEDSERETAPLREDASRIRLTAAPRERFLADQKIHHRADGRCRNDDAASVEELWFAERGDGRIHGCALDVTMEEGMLYSHTNASRVQHNGWIAMRTRPFELQVPLLDGLPRTPAAALDDLARRALAVAGDAVETDARMRPAERHARPWSDIPALVNGRTLLQSRQSFAWALYGYPEYRAFAHERLAADVAADLRLLHERFARLAPTASPEAVEEAVAASAAGRSIAERLHAPSAADVQRHLGAWLGDVPAHRLFVDWEALRADRWLHGVDDGADDRVFGDEWQALRRLFFVPSYARVLGLLVPVLDADDDAIGFWRVVLPRPGWLQPRLKNAKNHPEWRDLPLDLVPDRPLGFAVLREALSDAAHQSAWVAADYHVATIEYALLGKVRKHDPRRAFRDVRVEIALRAPDGEALRISARVAVDAAGGIAIDALEVPAPPSARRALLAAGSDAGR